MRKLLFMMIAMIFIVSAGSNLVGDHAFEILDVSSITFFSDLLLQFGTLTSSLSSVISSSFVMLTQTLQFGLSLVETLTSFFTTVQPLMEKFMKEVVPLIEKIFKILDTTLKGIKDFCDVMRNPIQGISDWLSRIFNSLKSFKPYIRPW